MASPRNRGRDSQEPRPRRVRGARIAQFRDQV